MTGKAQAFTAPLFDEALQKHALVLVDFWAEWCQPCQMLAPLIDDVSVDFKPQVLVGKVDVEACADVAERHAVRNLPTLVLFRDGKEVARHTGLLNKARLRHWLNQHKEPLE